MSRPRYLRPAYLRVVAGELWAVDELGRDAVDISAHCRSLGRRPTEHDSYARYWLNTWVGGEGRWSSSIEERSDGRARLVGDWPDSCIEITFDWARLPGWRLRRRVRLFDELGRSTPPEYSDTHLFEDLASGGVPDRPADRADCILDV